MFDIARFSYGYCDADVRKEAEQTLVADYYAVVAEEATKHGKQVGFEIQQVRFSIKIFKSMQHNCQKHTKT